MKKLEEVSLEDFISEVSATVGPNSDLDETLGTRYYMGMSGFNRRDFMFGVNFTASITDMRVLINELLPNWTVGESWDPLTGTWTISVHGPNFGQPMALAQHVSAPQALLLAALRIGLQNVRT